ncbi:MAG: CoA transferase [Devosia sp.]
MSEGGGPGPAPLAGVRVLDLSRVVSGPFCTMQLGDLGADIIKVEEPTRGDDSRAFGPPFQGGESAYFLSVNRNKKSLALDLKHPKAGEVVRRLVEGSDVLVENFRPGTAERLGIGYDALKAINPALIYCAISGFGRTGPERDRPGYDLILQGEAGIMDLTGEPDGPPTKIGAPVADLVSGLYAAQGVLAALRAREVTGLGQRVDVAMLDAVASVLTYNAGEYFATGVSPTRRGNQHPSIAPYAPFEASDGWINLGIANDAIWERFCRSVGREELLDDARFKTAPDRVTNRTAVNALVADIIATRPRRAWVELLEPRGVPVGALNDVGEVVEGRGITARGKIASLDHQSAGTVKVVDTPVELSASPTGARTAPPRLGEHTREILREVADFDDTTIEDLMRERAVMAPDFDHG